VRDAEARLAKLTAERASIEKRLADPGLYDRARSGEIAATQVRLKAIVRLVGEAEAAWLAAEEALEAAA